MIQLRKDQRLLVPWAQKVLTQEGGVLLADAPGFGKSYQALGVAQSMGKRPWIVSPRGLVSMWRRITCDAGIEAEILTHGALLSWRIEAIAQQVDADTLLIVDEAHAFVNPSTQRYQALATVCAGVPVMLLSATPFQNHAEDALNLLALFSGEARWLLRQPQEKEIGLQRLMQRVSVSRTPPNMRDVRYQRFDVRAEREAIEQAGHALSLQTEPRALMMHGLLSRRVSSYSAWAASIRRAAHYLMELREGVRHGRTLTREIFGREFSHGQRAFPFMLDDPSAVGDQESVDEQIGAEDIDRALTQLRRAARTVRARRHPTPWRWLLTLPRPVLLFSQYRSTVHEAYLHLRPHVRVARWTGAEVVSNFPRTDAPWNAQLSNTILLATDVAAEGTDLRACNTLVHADMHWNPMRTTQREGRIQRGEGGPPATIWAPRYPAELQDMWSIYARRAWKRSLIHRFAPRRPDEERALKAGLSAQTAPAHPAYIQALLRRMRTVAPRSSATPSFTDLWTMASWIDAHLVCAGAASWVDVAQNGSDALCDAAHRRLQALHHRLISQLDQECETHALT